MRIPARPTDIALYPDRTLARSLATKLIGISTLLGLIALACGVGFVAVARSPRPIGWDGPPQPVLLAVELIIGLGFAGVATVGFLAARRNLRRARSTDPLLAVSDTAVFVDGHGWLRYDEIAGVEVVRATLRPGLRPLRQPPVQTVRVTTRHQGAASVLLGGIVTGDDFDRAVEVLADRLAQRQIPLRGAGR